jgi:hypothetical protein
LGIDIRSNDQREPSQRSAKAARVPTVEFPTAVQSPAESQDTAISTAFDTGPGIRWTDHPDASAIGVHTTQHAKINEPATNQATVTKLRCENLHRRDASTTLDHPPVQSGPYEPDPNARTPRNRGQVRDPPGHSD